MDRTNIFLEENRIDARQKNPPRRAVGASLTFEQRLP